MRQFPQCDKQIQAAGIDSFILYSFFGPVLESPVLSYFPHSNQEKNKGDLKQVTYLRQSTFYLGYLIDLFRQMTHGFLAIQ